MIIGTGVDIAKFIAYEKASSALATDFCGASSPMAKSVIASGKPPLRELRGALCAKEAGMKALVRVESWRALARH